MQGLAFKISNSRWFQNFVILAILAAAVLIGMETYRDFYLKHQNILDTLNQLVLGVFVVEIVVKVLAEGRKPWKYFRDPWNVFDFVIVASAFLPMGGSSVALLRLLRLLRVLKLIKALPKLQILVTALLKSIPSMGYVGILLALLFYIYSVAAVFLFGGNDPIHFSDLKHSMLSMFRVVTLEDWTDVMYINMYGCENYGYSGSETLCTDSKASPWLSALFFVSFVLAGTMIFLNLFIGVIMNGMDEAHKEMEETKRGNQDSASDMELIQLKMAELQKLLERQMK